jgi:hypothetical protein
LKVYSLAIDVGLGTVAAVGLILEFGLGAGVLGVVLGMGVFAKLFDTALTPFHDAPGLAKLAIAGLIGTLIQTSLFSGYGWLNLPGMMIMVLTYRRLEALRAPAQKRLVRREKTGDSGTEAVNIHGFEPARRGA